MSYRDAVWQDDAACLGQPWEVFYPREGIDPVEAKEICEGCTVKNECLQDALTHEAPLRRNGVWGGMSATEREIVFDGRKPKPARTQCGQGHELTADNVVVVGRRRLCKTCRDNDPRRLENRTHCANGHDLSVFLIQRGGRLKCRQCEREQSTASSRRRRSREREIA